MVAARAFHHDPFFVHLTDKALLRARGLGIFWKSELASFGHHAEVLGARQPDGRLIGVAAWIKPGEYPLPVPAQISQAMGALWAMLPTPRALIDGSKYLLAIDKAHPKQKSWYLNLLVVDPAQQRGGIGAALQETVLERADQEGLPCYLETQNADNLPYYGRFGYQVVDELHPVTDGPPLCTMWREGKG
jgi:GNAT superfamily N-acetyltransferase